MAISKKKIFLVVGARPNFMKAAPLIAELKKHPDQIAPQMIHTGQHYDYKLSKLFFDELGMSKPDVYLGVGSGSHAKQTARIMIELEQVFLKDRPDLVVVFGDINSTLAASVVAAKLCIRLAHVESGLRSFDNSMPEEINRIVTDRLSDLLFVSEESGLSNLENEGVPAEKIHFVGNIMIDSLVHNLETSRKSSILSDLELEPNEYAVLTLHRPANVDESDQLFELMECIAEIAHSIPIIFPCHPRTKVAIEKSDLVAKLFNRELRLIEPLGYLDFLRLQSQSHFVLTDSGGIQEETTYLNIPCITLRHNTERPSTVTVGSNTIVGVNPSLIKGAAAKVLDGHAKKGKVPALWDGKTSQRIVEILLQDT